MDNINDLKNSKRSWLQRLKEESWEAELLVSTISIYGAFQMFNLIEWVTNKFIDLLNPNQYVIGYFIVFLGLLAVSILVSMFVIHFFLRAYWVGLVGLNSVFPDYSVEDSAYSKIYTEKMVAILPKLKNSIQKVDELCSVIFSAAFTFLLLYAYMALFASIYLLFFNSLSNFIPSSILLIPTFILVTGFLVQALVSIIANFKQFKENERIQTLNFNIVRIVSIISYGPLYKSILQVFIVFGSNFKKKKHIVYLLFLFVCSGVMVSAFQLIDSNIIYLLNRETYFDATRSNPHFYKPENETINFLLNPEIESDLVETSILKLFIPVYRHEKNLKTCNSDSTSLTINSKTKHKRSKEVLACYQAYHYIYINNEPIKVDFLRNRHPQTNQNGVITYLDISNLKTGLNTLTVKKQFDDENSLEWNIPFYYVPKN